jgi:ADP-ribose pyrophosphatase YjhB (NUDIX family)
MGKIFAYGVCLYKIEENDIKFLLCKSISSLNRWGFLKGVRLKNETNKQCAQREFIEECGIEIDMDHFEEYFEQQNEDKDIGIWLMNASNVRHLNKYIIDDKLLSNYLSWENSKVKFFSVKKLPRFKQKQRFLIKEIMDFLQNKHPLH